MASNETSKYKLSVVEGTELKLSLNGGQGPAGAVGPAGPTGGVGPAGPQGPSGLSSSTFPYVAKTTSTSGDPLSTFITWNQADQITSSTIRVSHIGSDTNDYDVLLSIIKGNDYVIIQSKTNSNKYQKFSVTGAPTIVPNSYIEIPVSNDSFGTSPTNFSNGDPILLIIQSVGLTGDPALLLAGGTMDADATITLDTTPDVNDHHLGSVVSGGGFSAKQYYVLDSYDHFTDISPYGVTVGRLTESSGSSLSSGGLTLTSDDGNGYVRTLSLNGDGMGFDNSSSISKGTTDAGLGGSKGVALKCSLSYELKWEAGRLYTMEQDGFEIRRVDHCGTTTPTTTDDSTKGFVVGSIWTLDDGTSYKCTSDSIDSAVWVANVPPNDSLPLAGGTMDTGAVITLDTAQDGNDVSTDSEVGGWGFGVEEKQNGTNTGKYVYLDTGGFHVESPEHVYVTATIEGSGTVDTLFTKSIDWNFKPSYEGGGYRLRYSGDQWYMDDLSGDVALLAGLGNEVYPWFASWPYGTTMTPTIGSTHLSNTALTFDNGARLKEGTTIVDGNGGIALKCSVDYELKWEAGRLYTMEQNGFTIRRVDHCRNIAPTANDDNSKGFVIGSIWTLDDGSSYKCTNASLFNATWVAHFPLTIGDGLSFNTGTNTISCNSNIARRAGNQTFTGVNTFSGQVELTGQALTNGTSAVTRDLGDVRYGTTYIGVNENNVSSTNNTPITLASITLPIGRYQIESCISATAASSAGGFLFGLSSSSAIKVTLVESYGSDNAVTFSNSIGSDSTTSIQRSIGTGLSYRRLLTGIIDVVTANTVVSIEFCQNTTNAIASTTRKRAYITARKIA